jgi:hypothetical protein
VSQRQRISANAIHALKDALTAAFWFKKDLYDYAKAAVAGEPVFLAGIDWTDKETLKRDWVSTFVDRLVREQDDHQDLLPALLADVANMSEFPHLARAEDAATKIKAAKAAVAHLKSFVKPYEQALAEQQAARDNIAAARAHAADQRASKQRLAELKTRYLEIVRMQPRPRGLRSSTSLETCSTRSIWIPRRHSRSVASRSTAALRSTANTSSSKRSGKTHPLIVPRSTYSQPRSTASPRTPWGCSWRSQASTTPASRRIRSHGRS